MRSCGWIAIVRCDGFDELDVMHPYEVLQPPQCAASR
jgi:hypothetical protein